jgi:hypothetical protein
MDEERGRFYHGGMFEHEAEALIEPDLRLW